MDITFYNNSSDERKINKNISQVGDTISGYLKEPCDTTNPIITINHSGIIPANYCYIDELNRYYFIDNQTILSNNRVRIDLTVDVLMSYKNDIMNIPVIIDGSTFNTNSYLASDIYKATVKTKTDVINFPSGLNDSGEYILITAGG